MRAGGWALAGALLLALTAPAPRAAAEPRSPFHERPFDAPAVEAPAPAPDITPEYTSVEEQGIKLVYHLRAREKAHVLMGRALACRAELAALLGHDVLANVEIRVAAAPAQMAALAPPGLPSSVTAAAFHAQRLVVMSLGSPVSEDVADLVQHLRHQLAHLALDEAAPGADLPRWFHEGFAIHVSGEDAAGRAETLTGAALRERLVGMRDVALHFPDGPPGESLYAAEAVELVRFLAESRPRFTALVHELAGGSAFDAALSTAYDGDPDALDRGFRKDLARRYGFVPVLAGATLVWVIVALGVVLRRRRLAAQRAQAADERRVLGAAARLFAHEPPVRQRPEEDELAQAMPPDPEVPKVEHDGRWYTLH